MKTHTVRIAEADHVTLNHLAQETGQSLTALLTEAIQELQRRRLLTQTNAAYARLKQDPTAWEEETRERALWERTLADGPE